MFTLIHGADGGMLAEVDFTAYGPYETVEAAQAAAEEIRGKRGLPREATPENNEIWTDAGHWFGIVPLRRSSWREHLHALKGGHMVSHAEAQELHGLLGEAVECLHDGEAIGIAEMRRAREIAAIIVSDTDPDRDL